MSSSHLAWQVIARMQAELARQSITAGLRGVSQPDRYGRVQISGDLDLAALADATETALIEMFSKARD